MRQKKRDFHPFQERRWMFYISACLFPVRQLHPELSPPLQRFLFSTRHLRLRVFHYFWAWYLSQILEAPLPHFCLKGLKYGCISLLFAIQYCDNFPKIPNNTLIPQILHRVMWLCAHRVTYKCLHFSFVCVFFECFMPSFFPTIPPDVIIFFFFALYGSLIESNVFPRGVFSVGSFHLSAETHLVSFRIKEVNKSPVWWVASWVSFISSQKLGICALLLERGSLNQHY